MAGCCGALARLTLGVCVNIWQGNSLELGVVDKVKADMGLVRKMRQMWGLACSSVSGHLCKFFL